MMTHEHQCTQKTQKHTHTNTHSNILNDTHIQTHTDAQNDTLSMTHTLAQKMTQTLKHNDFGLLPTRKTIYTPKTYAMTGSHIFQIQRCTHTKTHIYTHNLKQ